MQDMTIDSAIELMYETEEARGLLGEPEARPLLIKSMQKHVRTLRHQAHRGTYTKEELNEWVVREIREFDRLIGVLQRGG